MTDCAFAGNHCPSNAQLAEVGVWTAGGLLIAGVAGPLIAAGSEIIGAAAVPAAPLLGGACADGDCGNEVQSGANTLVQLRAAYENAVRDLTTEVLKRFQAGEPVEEIAQWAHQARRALGVTYKDMTPPDLLEQIYARNLEKYGDKLGPSLEYLIAKGKSWEEIIESAVTPGGQDIIPKLLQSIK